MSQPDTGIRPRPEGGQAFSVAIRTFDFVPQGDRHLFSREDGEITDEMTRELELPADVALLLLCHPDDLEAATNELHEIIIQAVEDKANIQVEAVGDAFDNDNVKFRVQQPSSRQMNCDELTRKDKP